MKMQIRQVRLMSLESALLALLAVGLGGCSPEASKPVTPPASTATKPETTAAVEPVAPTEPLAETAAAPQIAANKAETPAVTEVAAAAPPTATTPAPAATADSATVAVSKFAPAEDLVNQTDAYLKTLNKTVENEQEYKDAETNLPKDANTVIVIALALGLHDQDNRYKASAPAIIKAAQKLSEAKDYASAKQGVEALTAATSSPGGGPLKWEKVASLPELMKAVPLINTKLKRNTQGARFKSKAKDTEGYSAVIAAIAQASIADTSATKSPDDVGKWQGFCLQMRDAAGALNSALHQGDESAGTAALDKLAQSCDDCHQVFHPAALEKTKQEGN